MNFSEIINTLNPTGLDNILFYPVFTILISYCVTLLLYFYDSKNRNIHIFTSIPKIVSIFCISANVVWQIITICSDFTLFKMFILFTGGMVFIGFAVDFKVKYIFVSHVISTILHFCFYFYSKHYHAGILSELLHSSMEYLIILAIVYLLISWFDIKVGLSFKKMFVDRFLPKNEFSSFNVVILLQAYSMIIHNTAIEFLYSSTLAYWAYAIGLSVVLVQLIIIIVILRIMYLYPISADTPFYVNAHLMIIKTLIGSVYTHYKMFQEHIPYNIQPQSVYNTFIYLSAYVLVMCILSCDVAYASNEISGPIGEGPPHLAVNLLAV